MSSKPLPLGLSPIRHDGGSEKISQDSFRSAHAAQALRQSLQRNQGDLSCTVLTAEHRHSQGQLDTFAAGLANKSADSSAALQVNAKQRAAALSNGPGCCAIPGISHCVLAVGICLQ